MKIETYIDSLVSYAMNNGLAEPVDHQVLTNRILDLLQKEDYVPSNETQTEDLEEILAGILDYAVEKGLVDNGGSVIDVQVEHPIYGQISANLSISSRYDADEFIKAAGEAGAAQLSDLTGGIHIHTICAQEEKNLARICEALEKLGVIVEE